MICTVCLFLFNSMLTDFFVIVVMVTVRVLTSKVEPSNWNLLHPVCQKPIVLSTEKFYLPLNSGISSPQKNDVAGHDGSHSSHPFRDQ